jgi:hypothetical protein
MIQSLYKKFIVSLKNYSDVAATTRVIQTDLANETEERRWAKRLSVTLRVNLYRDGELVRHTLATDFSLNGLFLRCHRADLKVGDELALAIANYQDGTEKWYPMQVKVARVADSGVGMIFHHHDSHLFCGMNKLMHACNEQLHAMEASARVSHEHEAA